ncbi:hypothetical protein [Terriglobus aquaticus]|uniref:Lipocalin-like domain-containing protein n=1 Tax=Terriglobus aquaticus TaxID=940139 RepID=A0ABW9KI63_9BACT|nr:hypothetical protein [Terriglobus aquaticus]
MKLQMAVRKLRVRLVLIPTLVLFCFAAFATRANAACGAPQGTREGAAKLPLFFGADEEPLFINPSIVGMWHAIYTIEGTDTVFNDSFKTWHIDGTEVESAFLSPEGGNVCMGVWKSAGGRSVKLHHLGWLFNPATPSATATNYFTMDEVVTVAPNGKTYTGTFDFKVWNLDGTATPTEVKGTIAATRIRL